MVKLVWKVPVQLHLKCAQCAAGEMEMELSTGVVALALWD